MTLCPSYAESGPPRVFRFANCLVDGGFVIWIYLAPYVASRWDVQVDVIIVSDGAVPYHTSRSELVSWDRLLTLTAIGASQ